MYNKRLYSSFAGFHRFQLRCLSHTTRHEVELGTIDEVLEVSTGSELDFHRLDVLRRKLLDALRTHAAEADVERTQFAQHNLDADEQLFQMTLAHVKDKAHHCTAAIHTVVSRNVLGEFLQCPNLRHLVLRVSLSRPLLVHQVREHINAIVNHKVAHRRYGTWYLQGLMPCPAGIKK